MYPSNKIRYDINILCKLIWDYLFSASGNGIKEITKDQGTEWQKIKEDPDKLQQVRQILKRKYKGTCMSCIDALYNLLVQVVFSFVQNQTKQGQHIFHIWNVLFCKVRSLYEQKLQEYNHRLSNPTTDDRKRRDKWLIKKLEKLVRIGTLHQELHYQYIWKYGSNGSKYMSQTRFLI